MYIRQNNYNKYWRRFIVKILKPFYYDDFKCTANKCIDNCCSNWKIEIDEKTYKKYKKLKGEWGKKINSNISRKRSNPNYLNIKLANKSIINKSFDLLEKGLKVAPDNSDLRLQLSNLYLHNHQDKENIALFKDLDKNATLWPA